jgi:phosphatidylserine synthase
MQVLVATTLLLIGVLMVSTFRYWSPKQLDLRKRWSFRALVPFIAVVLLLFFLREIGFLILAFTFAASGPVAYLVSRLRSGGRPEDGTPPPVSQEPLP